MDNTQPYRILLEPVAGYDSNTERIVTNLQIATTRQATNTGQVSITGEVTPISQKSNAGQNPNTRDNQNTGQNPSTRQIPNTGQGLTGMLLPFQPCPLRFLTEEDLSESSGRLFRRWKDQLTRLFHACGGVQAPELPLALAPLSEREKAGMLYAVLACFSRRLYTMLEDRLAANINDFEKVILELDKIRGEMLWKTKRRLL
jgi:hypothetical protein